MYLQGNGTKEILYGKMSVIAWLFKSMELIIDLHEQIQTQKNKLGKERLHEKYNPIKLCYSNISHFFAWMTYIKKIFKNMGGGHREFFIIHSISRYTRIIFKTNYKPLFLGGIWGAYTSQLTIHLLSKYLLVT